MQTNLLSVISGNKDNNSRLDALVVRLGRILTALNDGGIDSREDEDKEAPASIIERLVDQGRTAATHISDLEELCSGLEHVIGDTPKEGFVAQEVESLYTSEAKQ